jgi:uncharacterized protein
MESLSHHIWIGFAGGLLGFAHCLGMCGGFVLHLSQGESRKTTIPSQLLWLAGKLFSYLFLGAVAGYAGGFLAGWLPKQALFQNLLSFTAGAIILLMGLQVLGLLPVRKNGSFGASLLSTLGRTFLATSSPGSALTLGLATGFLPCPIVLAFLAYALQSGSVATGMITMAALGLGTTVPLLLLGGFSRLLRVHLRSWAPKAGGILLVLLGLTTVLRGTAAFHHLLGCPTDPGLHPVAGVAQKPCCNGGQHGNGGGN